MLDRTAVVVAGVLALAAASCRDDRGGDFVPALSDAAAPSAESTALPADHVASDELVEGLEAAYGLKLPMGFHVTAHVDREITAIGDSPRSKVVKYILARAKGGTRVDVADITKLRDVTFADDPKRTFEVTVSLGPHFGTVIAVREMLKAPAPASMQQEEIFKQAGMDKYGRPLNPAK